MSLFSALVDALSLLQMLECLSGIAAVALEIYRYVSSSVMLISFLSLGTHAPMQVPHMFP